MKPSSKLASSLEGKEMAASAMVLQRTGLRPDVIERGVSLLKSFSAGELGEEINERGGKVSRVLSVTLDQDGVVYTGGVESSSICTLELLLFRNGEILGGHAFYDAGKLPDSLTGFESLIDVFNEGVVS